MSSESQGLDRMRKPLISFLITAGMVILLDQATKYYVTSQFRLHESLPVIEGFFSITYIRNPGAAFGFLAGASPLFRGLFFTVVTLIAVGLILFYLLKNRDSSPLPMTPLCLIFAGAVGNLVDRIRFGEVIDFLDVSIGSYHWPAFNVADSAISIGVAFLIVDMIRKRKKRALKNERNNGPRFVHQRLMALKPKSFLYSYLTPARSFILSFATVILAGALLLWMPFCSSGKPLRFVDALFTSASAVCVTGLAVVDIGKDLSLAGQLVTLLLFQIGGLGIITFSSFLFGLMGRGISFRGREIVQSTFLHTPRRDFFVILKWVLVLTLIIEFLGTLLLFSRFSQEFPAPRALYLAIYHAVSAFNNCGYSLFPNSFMDYRSDWIVNITVMGLIVTGGMGFIVLYEVLARLRGSQKRLSLHSRIVLLMTGFLILSGAVLFYVCEVNNVLKGASWQECLLASLFQSVTCRTSGFNTVDIGRVTNAGILLMVALMFIGASPGSTGGGIKTTSFALLLMMIWNRFRGSEHVNIFNRTVPEEILTRTISIIFASAFSISLITSILLLFGTPDSLPPEGSRHFFVEYLFETVSAYGTVGLSMGITAKLNDLQKLAIILMMFAGRVGPLTLAFSWSSPKRKIVYAEESVMVG